MMQGPESCRIPSGMRATPVGTFIRWEMISFSNGTLSDGIYPQGLIGYSTDNQVWLQHDGRALRPPEYCHGILFRSL